MRTNAYVSRLFLYYEYNYINIFVKTFNINAFIIDYTSLYYINIIHFVMSNKITIFAIKFSYITKMSILEFCNSVPDCRNEKNRLYTASELVFITLVSVLCGSDTWGDVELFCRSQFDYFKKRLPNLKGVPSHDTLNRFFSVLDTSWFESAFRSWVADLCDGISGVVAIDGKAVCRNPESKSNSVKNRLYMVSAWASENGICLGQEKVDSKSNEITALPKLIEALDLEGCIVTIDAIGCQKSIAKAIRKAGADYLLCAKKNQKNLRNIVAALVMEEHKKDGMCKWCEQEDEGHGRKEWRECVCVDFERLVPYFLEGWTDLRTLARVTEKRRLTDGTVTEDTRYYITSLPEDPKLILKASRRHWSVENELHWRMDVAFREDYSRKKDNAAINFSAICKIALMKLKECKLKVGLASKRKMCGWDERTRDMVLGIA